MVEDITLELLGVADLHIRSQEGHPLLGRVPDKCPNIFFLVLEIKKIVIFQIVSIFFWQIN